MRLRDPPSPALRRRVRLLAAVALLAPLAAPAALYKWVDADGNVTFSDQPPPEAAGGVEKLGDEVPRHEPPPPENDAYLPVPPEGESPEYTGAPAPEPQERYTCEEARRLVAIHENRGGKPMYAPVGEKRFEPLGAEQVDGMLEGWRAVRDRVCGAGAGESAPAPDG